MDFVLLAWIAVPVLFWTAWLIVTGARPLRHIGTLHFALYFLSIYAGSFAFYDRLGRQNSRFMFSVMAYPFLALCGAVAAGLLDGGRFAVFHGVVPRRSSSRSERRVVALVTLGLFAALGVFLLILGNRIPLLVVIRDGDAAGQIARYVATKGYNEAIGRVGPLVWTSRILIDYFGLYLLIYQYCRIKVGESSRSRFFGLLTLLVLATVLFNERYPVVKLLFYFAVVAMFGIERPRISARAAVRAAVMFVLLIPAIGVVHTVVTHGPRALVEPPTNTVSALYYEGWTLFLDRVVGGQVGGLYYIYEIVPRHFDFFHGRTYGNPRGLLPYEQVNLPSLVYDWYQRSPEGVQGSDPSAFFGEVYANFGLLVSCLSMFAMGAILQGANDGLRRLIDRHGTPYYIALFFLTGTYLADFALGSTTVYFDARFYLIVLMCVAPRLTVRRLPVRSRRLLST